MIEIVQEEIRLESVLAQLENPASGAWVLFDGRVRDHARGKRVTHLFYETYDAMARKELAKIREAAMRRWPLTELAIVHRVGRLEIGDSSVLIAAASPHRADAFEACRFAIDTLKTTVPIWKKEFYEDGEVWVEEYGG